MTTGPGVVIKGPMNVEDMLSSDLIWNCYMHTCSRHTKGAVMTMQSLLRRFDTDDTDRMCVLIEHSVRTGLIKEDFVFPKGFVPYWA